MLKLFALLSLMLKRST